MGVVGRRIGGGVQPELLIIHSNYGFVERHLIQGFTAGRLEIGLLDAVVVGFATLLDTKHLEFGYYIGN